MTGIIWDELQRLKLALHSLDSDLQERHSPSDQWPRVIEAMRALEDAIAEAWPPQERPVILPYLTDSETAKVYEAALATAAYAQERARRLFAPLGAAIAVAKEEKEDPASQSSEPAFR